MIDRAIAVTVVWILVCALVARGVTAVLAAEDNARNDALGLLSIGNPGSRAIPLHVWIIKESDAPFIRGDSVVLQVQVEEEGHLTIVAASSSGKVSVLFPNGETQASTILKNEVHALFGDDSPLRIKLGDTVETSKLAFFVTSKPVPLEPLRASEKAWGVSVAAGDNADFQTLKKKIEQMAKDPGFNRVIISLKDEKGSGLEAELTKSAHVGGKRPTKRLPQVIKSDRPGSVTGAQGVKQKLNADQ